MTTGAQSRLTRLDPASGATAHTRVTTVSRGPLVRGLVAALAAVLRVRDGILTAVEWVGQVVTPPAGWCSPRPPSA